MKAVHSIFIFSAIGMALAGNSPAAQGDGKFLAKRDFRVTIEASDSVRASGASGFRMPGFDFSASGDTGTEGKATGSRFRTEWKSKCSEPEGNCNFLLRVVHQKAADMDRTGPLPLVESRIKGIGSSGELVILTSLIQDGEFSKLESRSVLSKGDSIFSTEVNRKVGEFRLPGNAFGYELKFSLSRKLGRMVFALYSRPIDGHYRFAQMKMNLPKGFSADSIGFSAMDSVGRSGTVFSEAFAGSRINTFVTPFDAGYLKRLSKGDLPGKDARFDYFAQAIYKLIKAADDTNGQFGSMEAYHENVKRMLNASEGGYLMPIQIVRANFQEKGQGGAMATTPLFLCTTPRREISSKTASLYLDPGFIYGDPGLQEVKITVGNAVTKLERGESLKLDFSKDSEKKVDIEVAYSDGFRAKTPLTIALKKN